MPTEAGDCPRIREVSLAYGLEHERTLVSHSAKVRLAEAVIAAGVGRLLLTGFGGNPGSPQHADAMELARELVPVANAALGARCSDTHGMELACAARLAEVELQVSATESHQRTRSRRSVSSTLELLGEELAPYAAQTGLRLVASVEVAWGCPYSGDVPIETVVWLASRLNELGCAEVILADTFGVANPRSVSTMVRAVGGPVPLARIGFRAYDTRGMGTANAIAAYDAGVRSFDTSLGGIGGCRYADAAGFPEAPGLLATEDLGFCLESMGISTGLDLALLAHASRGAATVLGRPLPGRINRAGLPQRR